MDATFPVTTSDGVTFDFKLQWLQHFSVLCQMAQQLQPNQRLLLDDIDSTAFAFAVDMVEQEEGPPTDSPSIDATENFIGQDFMNRQMKTMDLADDLGMSGQLRRRALEMVERYVLEEND
ncbi:hypothetical protein L596_017002 [Steinernema carpocapsae]|uniref:Uncharacterized protein n=1 Tax=Steinernema carpocapsae TaxID=34508 RepID=A0A4U5N0H2_STECR|nr:hypothetical protein L596_017002 [Steinernema carpocapsae]